MGVYHGHFPSLLSILQLSRGKFIEWLIQSAVNTVGGAILQMAGGVMLLRVLHAATGKGVLMSAVVCAMTPVSVVFLMLMVLMILMVVVLILVFVTV